MEMFRKPKAIRHLPVGQKYMLWYKSLWLSKKYRLYFFLYILWLLIFIVLLVFNVGSETFIFPLILFGNMAVVFSFCFAQDKILRSKLGEALFKSKIRPKYCGCCEYDLHGTDGDYCPECGVKLASKYPVTLGAED